MINDSDVIVVRGNMLRKRNLGFTLVELLIAIAILGILYSLAMPSYTRYMQESRRSDAQQVLVQQAAVLERLYTRQGGYPKEYAAAQTDFYQFTYQPSETQTIDTYKRFTLTATPITGKAQASDRCGTLSVDEKGSFGAAANDCWY
ncbi:Type IV pilus biogenesis protein PilE [Pseudoalteromonas luteoviolacea B = ATCC 29581]|nr:Type IV pilus biogenesis protein PilE [Pseudoalteromonas luteoviolacea B = ATCC 29581]